MMGGISEMFLIPKRIHLNIIKNIEDPNQLKRIEELNAETNYLEKALQFHRLKSFKSQPKEEEKESSSSKGNNDTHFTVNDNSGQRQTNNSPQQISNEQSAPLPVVTGQNANSSTTSAPRGRKRPVIDEKLDMMETTQVKLARFNQQEINKQIKGKKNPTLKQMVEKIKNYLRRYRWIDGKELKEGVQKKGKEGKKMVKKRRMLLMPN